jgi:hypothetical protein
VKTINLCGRHMGFADFTVSSQKGNPHKRRPRRDALPCKHTRESFFSWRWKVSTGARGGASRPHGRAWTLSAAHPQMCACSFQPPTIL